MTPIALPPPPGLVIDIASLALAQGREGRILQKVGREALRHWQSPSGSDLVLSEDDFRYDSPPLETAFTIQARYEYTGELPPLPYPFED